MTQEEFKK